MNILTYPGYAIFTTLITADNPNEEDCGPPEQVIETVCVQVGTETWSWASGIMGAWSMQWWEDQLAKYEPSLTGEEQAGMMAGFADAMGGMSDLWYWSAGNSVQRRRFLGGLFDVQDSGQVQIQRQIFEFSSVFSCQFWKISQKS